MNRESLIVNCFVIFLRLSQSVSRSNDNIFFYRVAPKK